jgi:hypothetical protein
MIDFTAPAIYEKMIQETEYEQIRLVVSTFRDVEYISLRKYYLDFEEVEIISLAESKSILEEEFKDILDQIYLT